MKVKAVLMGNLLDFFGTMAVTIGITIIIMAIGKIFRNNLPITTYEFLTNPEKQKPLMQGIGIGFSILGGYVSARMAKERELLYGALSALLCTITGIYSIIHGHHFEAKLILLEPLSLVLGIFGGYICLKMKRKAPNTDIAKKVQY